MKIDKKNAYENKHLCGALLECHLHNQKVGTWSPGTDDFGALEVNIA